MPFSPKDQSTILRNLLSLVVNRTELNDVAPGSILYTLMAGISNEIASTERRLSNIRDSFYLQNVSGADLDQRVSELPLSGLSRRGESAASGACLSITRDDSDIANELIINSGSKVSGTNGVSYTILQDVIFAVGENIVENVFIRADKAGVNGNIQSGQINQPLSLPDQVISVRNTQPITNGQDRETDVSLRKRAAKYLESLARTQPSALEYLALSFEPSDGSKFSFASVFEDPTRPAYSELLVDDGSGLTVESVSRSGRETTATVPAGGQFLLYHEAPATQPITAENINITRPGAGVIAPTNAEIISIPERGVVYLPEGYLQPGDVWTINNYKVFVGGINELQAEIEGNNSDSRISGFRASGCRVRVVPPEVQLVSFDIALAPDPNYDFAIVEYSAKQAAIGYISTLGINDILYTSRLIDQILNVNGVVDVEILNSGEQTRLANVYPRDKRTILRTNDNLIGVSSRIILED